MRGIKSTIALLALAAATACTPVDTTFGDAVKTDYSLQVINPDPAPVSAETAVIEGGDGSRAAAATERYRKGEVKQPQSIQTSNGRSGGGGSASAGSGSN